MNDEQKRYHDYAKKTEAKIIYTILLFLLMFIAMPMGLILTRTDNLTSLLSQNVNDVSWNFFIQKLVKSGEVYSLKN